MWINLQQFQFLIKLTYRKKNISHVIILYKKVVFIPDSIGFEFLDELVWINQKKITKKICKFCMFLKYIICYVESLNLFVLTIFKGYWTLIRVVDSLVISYVVSRKRNWLLNLKKNNFFPCSIIYMWILSNCWFKPILN